MAVEIPDKNDHRAAWAALTMADRRRVMRAVTRGVAVEDRKDALLAIGAAQQQKFFWKWAWGLGPLLGVVLLDQGWQVVVLNIVLSTGLIVGLSRWRWLRADRCQKANIEVLEGPRRKKPKTPKSPSAHLPGDRGPAKASSGGAPGGLSKPQPDWPGEAPDPNTSKAKLKRRKKRR